MLITRIDQAPSWTLPGMTLTGLLAPSRGAQEISLWWADIEANASREPHWLDHEEAVAVITGTLRITVDDETSDLNPGDAIKIPANGIITLHNPGTVPMRALVCTPVTAKAWLATGEALGTPPWAQ